MTHRTVGSRLKCWWPDRATAHDQLARIADGQRDNSEAKSQIKKARKNNRETSQIMALSKKLHVTFFRIHPPDD